MISALRVVLALIYFAGALATAAAQDVQRPLINIAFVEIENDPRYEPVRAYERIILKARAHPFTGAELGRDDAAPLARMLKADFALQRITVKSPADVASAVLDALAAGTHFFLIDAPAESFKPLAAAMRGRDAFAVQRLRA